MSSITSQKPSFKETQLAFSGHIRNPEKTALPNDVPDARMAVYREIFYNNVEGLAANNFPVLRSITDDDNWHHMVRDFFANHKSQTPIFTEFAQEFLHYLEKERVGEAYDPPFLLELAHYEWLELALAISEEEDKPETLNTNGDLLNNVPVVSELALPLSYQYPVHQISEDFIPEENHAQPTFLVINRDLNDEVHFLEINNVTFRLLQLLKENTQLTGLDILKQIAIELNSDDIDSVVNFGTNLLNELRARHIILGTRQN